MTHIVSNPVLTGFHPDPCMIYVDGTYYIATSTFEYYPGVKISASEDLANWRTAAYPLSRLDLLDMRGNAASTGVWAPALSYRDGLFWLVFTNQRQWLDGHLKDTENFLTTCEKIDGTWSAPVYLNSSGFDPSLFHDDDGKKYIVNMNWDYRGNDDGQRFCGIYIQEYDHALKKLVGKPRKIFDGTERRITEGPHIFKRNGYYYLLTAEGGTGLPHCATLARSRTLYGPYELHPNKHIITAYETDCYLQKAGHASICEGREGEWVMAHLCGRPLPNGRCILGRETAIQNIEWRDDGWVYLKNNTMYPDDSFKAHAPENKRVCAHCYSFDAPTLSVDFMTLRQPISDEIFSLAERPGYLTIRGGKSLMSLRDQSVLLRRQEAFSFTAETLLEFRPESFNHWAGLLYRYSEQNQLYLFVSYDENTRRRELLKITYDDAQFRLEKAATLPADVPVYLRLDVEGDKGRFGYSLDGKSYLSAGEAFDASKLSDEYNRPLAFTGAFVGIGCQDMQSYSKKAAFEYFKYTEVPGSDKKRI